MGSKFIFLRIRKIKAISSFSFLRCAFCFPMAASCCLLLSPLYHCLDSLRLPQEGKVDIYVEAFGLTISRGSFFARSQAACHWYKHIFRAVWEEVDRLRQWPSDVTGEEFSVFFVSHKCWQAVSPTAPLTHIFHTTPQDAPLFFFFFIDLERCSTSIWASSVFEWSLAAGVDLCCCLIGWECGSAQGQRCLSVSSSSQKNTAGQTSDVRARTIIK